MSANLLDDGYVKRLQTSATQEEVYDSDFSVGGSFGVRLSRTGRKAFFVIYPLHGKRKRMTIGYYPLVSVSDAREKALGILERAGRGEDPAAEWRAYRASEGFADVVALYCKEHLSLRSKKTSSEYERIFERELLPLWKDRKLKDISGTEIARLIEHIAQQRGTPVLGARVRAVIGSLFSFAQTRGFVSKNPAHETEPPKQKEPRERVLSLKELHALFLALREEDATTQALFKVLVLTGQRISTVLKMNWHDIRLDIWHVPIRGDSGASIFLVPQVMQALKEVHTRDSREPLVFPGARGETRSLARTVGRLNERMKGSLSWNALDLYRTFQAGLSGLGIRPDVVDALQQRRAVLNRRRFTNAAYDYSEDMRAALQKWAKAALPQSTAVRSDKVVPLFK